MPSVFGRVFTKDGKAYTEDNSLIYTIFVYSIPYLLTEADICGHFSKFGVISDVRLLDAKKRSRRASSTVGFVKFVEPESAYRALQEPIQRIQDSYFGVRAANSWNQPNVENTCSERKPATEAVCNTKQREDEALNVNAKWAGLNILSLNDDCLEIICDQLGLRDQIRFARVCPRFRQIFKMLSRRKYKRLDFDEMKGMTLWEIRDFLRFAGKHIEEASGNVPFKNRERIITFFRNCCVNLKRLTLYNARMKLNCQRKLFCSFPLLQELHLYGSEIIDLSLEPLMYLNQLECLSLTLCDAFWLRGGFISSLVQLKVLKLYGCRYIPSSNLAEICFGLPNLKSLDIRHCYRLTAIFLYSLADHCKQLEILKISCQDIPYERISFPPRLKHIELLLDTDFSVSHTPIFFKLAENNSQQLETLKIDGKNSINNQQISLISKLEKLKSFCCTDNQAIDDDALREFCKLEQLEELVIGKCDGVTNGGLLKLLRSCKHLRHLNIEFCTKITNEFVLEAINVLKDRKDRSPTPLVVFVEGTSIDKSGLSEFEKYKVAEKESLIKVVFKTLTVDKALDVNEIYDLSDSDSYYDDDIIYYDDDIIYSDEDNNFYFMDSDIDEYNDSGKLFSNEICGCI